MLASFLTEFYLGRVEFLISDGFRYYNKPEEWIVDIDRALWGYMNYFVKYIDIGGDFFIKIINIPILLIALYLLKSVFSIVKSPFWFVLACPSLLYLSVSNLRDVLIWVLAFLVFKTFFKKTGLGFIAFTIAAVLLYMLRPFMLVTALISIFIYEIIFVDKKLMINRYALLLRRVSVLIAFCIVGVLVYPLIKPKLESYLYNGTWLLESGYANIAKQKGVGDLIDSSNIPKALGFAVIRYVMTPQPDSIVRRWVSSEYEGSVYGFSSEAVRFLNQLVYYFLLIYLLINFRTVFSSFSGMNSTQKSLLTWMFLFMPIYAFVHFGGSHQRLKLPFQMMVFILAVYSYNYKLGQSKKILA
jgi:hypothetical protein